MTMSVSLQIHEIVERARAEGEAAERSFDRAATDLQIRSSSRINLYDSDAFSRASSLLSDAKRAGDELYTTMQGLVGYVNRSCKPLLAQGAAKAAVKEVADLISWLNEESKIDTNITGSIGSDSLGQLSSRKYTPTVEARMIEQEWERAVSSMSGTTEEDKKYALETLVAEEAKRKKESELRAVRARQASIDAERRKRQNDEYEKVREAAKAKRAFEEEQAKTEKYLKAQEGLKIAKEAVDYSRLSSSFGELGDFADAAALKKFCEGEAARLKEKKSRETEFENRQKLTKFGIYAGIFLVVVIVLAVLLKVVVPGIRNSVKYNDAQELWDSGNYDEAVEEYEELGNFKDSASKVYEVKYSKAGDLYENGDYFAAADIYAELGVYSDSADRLTDCYDSYIESQCDTGEDVNEEILSQINSIPQEYREKCTENLYRFAVKCVKSKEWSAAEEYFGECGDYKESSSYIDYCKAVGYYNDAQNESDYRTVRELFRELNGFSDADSYVQKCDSKLMSNATLTLDEAVEILEEMENRSIAMEELLSLCNDVMDCQYELEISKISEEENGDTDLSGNTFYTLQMEFEVINGVLCVCPTFEQFKNTGLEAAEVFRSAVPRSADEMEFYAVFPHGSEAEAFTFTFTNSWAELYSKVLKATYYYYASSPESD